MNKDRVVLQTHLEEFLVYKNRNHMTPSSLVSYRNTLRLFWNSGYTCVTTTTVEEFLGRYTNAATYNKALNHLRSFARWARRRGEGYWKNTADHLLVEAQKVNLDLPVTVPQDSADKLLAALRNVYPKTWAFVQIQANTGLRFTEVLTLRKTNFKLLEGGVPAVVFRGKGGRERIVTMNAAAVEAFRVWVADDRFPCERTIRYQWARMEKQTGIEHVRPHWFRHTVATKLDAQNVSADRIADLLGNSVEVVRSRYRRMNHHKLAEVTSLL